MAKTSDKRDAQRTVAALRRICRQRRVKMPDACRELGLNYRNTYRLISRHYAIVTEFVPLEKADA